MYIHQKTFNENGDKWCPKCKQYVPTKEFNKNKNAYMGLAGWCMYCKSKDDKEIVQQRINKRILRADLEEILSQPPIIYPRIFTSNKPVKVMEWGKLLETKLFKNTYKK